MGNSESKSTTSLPQSPATPNREGANRDRLHHEHNESKRRQSLAPHAKKDQPPTATLISSALPSTSHQDAYATITPSPASGHSRKRSVTTSTPRLAPQDAQGSGKTLKPEMGFDQSKPRPPSRSATLPPANSPALSATKPPASPSARPVDVPLAQHAQQEEDSLAQSGYPESPYNNAPMSGYNRPPRLPLPIEEEPHTPGSPIPDPMEMSTTIDANDVEGVLPRRTSMLSSTTADEEDAENDTYADEQQKSLAPTVPMTLWWKHGGEKVYVTGTFVQWERKFKLHKDKETGNFTATLQFKPGTHHLKFLVDGDMQVSGDLPTTVDYTNILVNYIEVIAPLPPSAAQPPPPSQPMAIPGSAVHREREDYEAELPSRTRHSPGGGAIDDADLEATQRDATSDVPTPRNEHNDPHHHQQSRSPQPNADQHTKKASKPHEPRPRYTSQIPDFLVDLDKYTNPDDPDFQRASRVIGHLPQPPSLPMFLGKSILNGNTPHKDDASVLIMPNHTVLNHLATSSIRNGVLATSGTTRYKRKVSGVCGVNSKSAGAFLTTVMYKPTSDDG